MSLPDGRDLAWLDMGRPDAPTVFAFHGSPGSGREFEKYETVAAGVRLIAPDRPGYGDSTFHPGRSFASWTDDVARLADHLAISRFAVVGVSSGAPNAVACARFLSDRLTGCAVVSGPAPPETGVSDDGMLAANRIERKLLRFAPRLAPLLLAPVVLAALRAGQRKPDRAMDFIDQSVPPCDAAILADPELRAAIRRDLARPLAATAGRAEVQDFALEVSDWGFRLGDITIPVHVWHGEHDRNVPISHGTAQAAAIPESTMHEIVDVGHLLAYTHMNAILRAIAPESTSKDKL